MSRFRESRSKDSDANRSLSLYPTCAREHRDIHEGGAVKRVIVAVIATATLMMGLFACSSGSPSPGSSPPPSSPAASESTTPPTATTQAAYPASVDQNYLSACEQSSNGNVAVCQCTLNWFERNITYTQFLADEDMVRSGQIPADVTNAEDACD